MFSTLPPPLTITHPLQPEDFADDSFGNTFLDYFNNTLNALKFGFNNTKPSRALNRDQWLWAAAETMAAIHTSLCKALPHHDAFTFLTKLGLDKDMVTSIFTTTVQALSMFTTTPPTPNGNWHQCAGCLKVANSMVTAET